MSSRDAILKRLRAAQVPFEQLAPIAERTVASPNLGDLQETFVKAAAALGVKICQAKNEKAALDYILAQIGEDKQILAWDLSEIPLKTLGNALEKNSISIADSRSDAVRFGITGVDAALAATGSVVVSSTVSKPRTASLLPYVHLAVVKSTQILPDLETWISQSRAAIRQNPNHIIITGASRTADIAMELVMGAHGPAELHLLIID